MVDPGEGAVGRWSSAIREIEVLEPWLTESHWDEHYWDDVATDVVAQVGGRSSQDVARTALIAAFGRAFRTVAFESDNGFYLDNLDRRVDLIVALALGPIRQPEATSPESDS